MHSKKENVINLELDVKNVLKNVVNKKSQYTIPIFIPHEGCKNACVFCNQRKISGKSTSATAFEVRKTIEEYLNYFLTKSKDNIEIAFFGGSFTGISIKKQEEFLSIANEYILSGKVNGIRLSTRPDYINPKILKMLKKYNVKVIELGVQSMSNKVLKASNRGHDTLSVIRASRLIKLYNITLGHQVMVGLPESDINEEIYSIKRVIRLNPSEVRIYPVYVIGESKLYDMYENGSYIPLGVKEAIERTYAIMNEISKTNIRVIRMGLQSTAEITSLNNEIKGPVCDNFAEYVLAKMIRKYLEDNILKISAKEDLQNRENVLQVITDLKYASVIIGPKKINKEYFYNKYNLKLKLKAKGECN